MHGWLPGALAALVASCPAVAAAAPVTGEAIGATPSTALVTATGASASARVVFGQAGYDGVAPAAATGDEFLLGGLQPATVYHYRVEVPDGQGGWTPGADRTVTTSPASAPELVARPTAAQSGGSMTCSLGTWAPGAASSVVWTQDATTVGSGPVFGALTAGDYACRVTATNGSASSYMTSRPAHFSGPRPPPPVAITKPAVLGAEPPQEGTVVSCDRGEWTGAAGFELQWLRDGSPISGETNAQHAVVAADAGHGLACQVTARGPGGSAVAGSVSLAVPASPLTRPAVNAAGSSTPPGDTVLVSSLDGVGLGTDPEDAGVSASAALKTLLGGRLPTRRALLRRGGARLRFRSPAPLGMLRVTLVSGADGTALARGARWYDTSRPGVLRLRLTNAGRRALRGADLVFATLVARFVPDHGRSQTESRRVTLAP